MKRYWRAVFILVQKDVLLESRTKALYLSAVSFGILLLLLLGFAMAGSAAQSGASPRMPYEWEAGLMWLVVFVVVMLALIRQDDKERWEDALSGTLSAPVDRSALYVSRVISNLVFVFCVEVVMLPLFFLIVQVPLPVHFLPWLGVTVLGTVGLIAIGTFLNTVGAASSLREILIPVLFLPLAVPLFLGVVELTYGATAPTLSGVSVGDWWYVLIGYVILFTAVPGLLFELLVEV